MTQVTQLIPSYLGGVSKQTDDKKKPGQVSEITNAMPDITYGLLKRSGFNWIRNVVDSNGESLDYAKWFFVSRGGLDAYVGCITQDTGSKGNISLWNAITGIQAEIKYPDGKDYLDLAYNPITKLGPEQLYSVTTIQDVTIVTNTTKIVGEQTAPGDQLLQNGTVKIQLVEYGADYTVNLNGTTSTIKTRNFDDAAAEDTVFLDADEILTDLKTAIQGKSIPGLTITQLSDCLELQFSGENVITNLSAIGGVGNGALDAYATDVTDVSKLATQSIEGRTVQIINGSGEEDDYWLKFDPEFGTEGPGTWIECRDPAVSAGLDGATAPHELEFTSFNSETGVATFSFQQIPWVERIAGDDITNTMPSFVGNSISYTFFYSNRFGVLSNDNVILSTSNDPYNFFKRTAQALVDSDPIDLNVSSIQPVRLISVRPEPQGLVLFGNNEQFKLYSLDSALTPISTQIRTLSNYEIADYIPPESVGTSNAFISKVPNYSRCFLYETQGLDENPSVVDIGKTVSQWLPNTITNISCSPQNSVVMLSGSSIREIYVYRFFNTGREDLFQAWTKWRMPGVVVALQIINDQIFTVTKQGNQYTLMVSDLNENSQNKIITAPLPFVDDRIWSNPYLDLMFTPSNDKVTYDAETDQSTIALPYDSVDNLIPTVMVVAEPVGGFASQTSLLSLSSIYDSLQTLSGPSSSESGYFVTPTVVGNTWVLDGDWTSFVSRIVCGYRFVFEIEFPTTYYNPGEEKYDYSANLTIARHKFSVSFTGALTFSLQSLGRTDWQPVYQVTDADYYHANQAPLIKDRCMTIPIYRQNKAYKLKVEDTTPFPTSIISQMWEGNYVPRFYKRKIN